MLGVIEREGTDTDHPENKTQLDKTRQDKITVTKLGKTLWSDVPT